MHDHVQLTDAEEAKLLRRHAAVLAADSAFCEESRRIRRCFETGQLPPAPNELANRRTE